jgi:hypothetical protein
MYVAISMVAVSTNACHRVNVSVFLISERFTCPPRPIYNSGDELPARGKRKKRE